MRTVPVALWNGLIVRDRHCRFPGCDRPPKFCEADHVFAWELGGETSLTNLVMFCSRHHHLKHKPGWQARLEPDGTLHLQEPGGQRHVTYPPDHPDFRFPAARFADAA